MTNVNTNDGKIWLITGASREFGRVRAEAVLQRGDRVVTAARDIDSISDFKDKYGDNVLILPDYKVSNLNLWVPNFYEL